MWYKVYNSKGENVTNFNFANDALRFVEQSGRTDLVVYKCDWHTGRKIKNL